MIFLRRTPFFRLLLPVISGILAHNYWELPRWCVLLLFAVSVLFIIFSFTFHRLDSQYKFRWMFGCGISLFLLTLSYGLCMNGAKQNTFSHAGKRGVFLIELTKPPIEKERSFLCEIKTLQFSDSLSTSESKGKGYIYLQKDSLAAALSFGDRLIIEAEFNPPENFRNPEGFDYAKYLKRKGIEATAYVASDRWSKTGKTDKLSIPALAQQYRRHLLNIFRRFNFPEDNFAVLAALSFGYTDELDPDLRNSYGAAGITHILAVSGLHVGIIYFILTFLFHFLNKSPWQRNMKTILIILLLWCYAFITGLPPSASRATLMFSFVAASTIFERKSSTYNTIFMSAFFMLLFNPNLLFHIGFQLSYSAVLSIVYFQPRIAKLLYFSRKPAKWLWNLLTVSVAAQIGTIPFTLYYFQTFPNYFLLTNIIAIPATSVILYLTICLLICAPIPFISTIIAFLLNAALTLLNASVHFIERLPHATSTIAFNEFQAVLIVVLMFSLSYYAYSKKYYSLITALSCVFLIFAINISIKYNTVKSRKMIVYSTYRNTHANFILGNRNYIYTDNFNELSKIANTFWNSNKIGAPVSIPIPDGQESCVLFNGRKILILKNDFSLTHTTKTPLQVDYLIIGNALKPRAKELLECINPKHIVVDQTITPWYSQQLQTYCKEKGIPFHSTRNDGAFILETN